MRGRANRGLLARSRFSKRIRRLNFGRGLVVFVVVEEFIEVELLSEAVVVTNQRIEVKIELVGDREDPVLKELTI